MNREHNMGAGALGVVELLVTLALVYSGIQSIQSGSDGHTFTF